MADATDRTPGEPRLDAPARGADGRVSLAGAWTIHALRPRLRQLRAQLRSQGGHERWDATDVESIDVTGASVLWNAWGRRWPKELLLRPDQEAVFQQVAGGPVGGGPVEGGPVANSGAAAPGEVDTPDGGRPASGSAASGVVAIGRRVLAAGEQVKGFVALLGELLLESLRLVREPARAPLRELSAHVYRAGAMALPITAMVGLLIGIVVGYLSAQQLRTFGANVLIVNLLGISILRELGPLLAAILIAGRSGSAMTAQIGVMHVTQELDALAALGISPTLRLVLPRVAALTLALPLLVVWTDVIALLGGVLASELELGIGLAQFVDRLPDVVPAVNLWIGVGKGAVFGAVIAVVACHYGLRVEPNTESLGAGTTASVVSAITLVLVADAVFAVALSGVGLGGLR